MAGKFILFPNKMVILVIINKIVIIHTNGDCALRSIIIILCALMILKTNAQEKSNIHLTNEFNAQTMSVNILNSYSITLGDNIVPQKHSLLNITGQAVVGTVLAGVFAIIPAGAIVLFPPNIDNPTSAKTIIYTSLAYSTYLLGAAVGVYWVAKCENENVSFGKTFLYSIMGGACGALLFAILPYEQKAIHSNLPLGLIIVALCPIISSMIYTSFIADWNQ